MNKVLITGASGLLGRALVKQFSENSWEVLGLAYSRAKGNLIKVDLNDVHDVQKIIKEYLPNVIIHCAAQRSPDKVEKDYEGAKMLNVVTSKKLAELSKAQKTAFVYISTDYVFDGTNPPYSEDDMPNPLNLYGKTKLEGEEEVLKSNPDSCVLRIPVIYGDEEYIGESAISSLIPCLLDQKTPSKISNFEVRFPSHVKDVAYVCMKLAEKKLKDPTINSLFHYCGKERLTKYDMAKIIAAVHNLSISHITPDNSPSTGAQRPKNTQLSCKRLESLGISQYTPFHTAVADFQILITK